MGSRTSLELKYDEGEVYLYSHWDDEDDLKNKLSKALIRGKERWNDHPYLARIIFSEFIKDEINELTGYGISPYDCGDYTIEIDLSNQQVDGIDYEKFIQERMKYNSSKI